MQEFLLWGSGTDGILGALGCRFWAWHSGLWIRRGRSLQLRSQLHLSDLTPGPGTSICCRVAKRERNRGGKKKKLDKCMMVSDDQSVCGGEGVLCLFLCCIQKIPPPQKKPENHSVFSPPLHSLDLCGKDHRPLHAPEKGSGSAKCKCSWTCPCLSEPYCFHVACKWDVIIRIK